MRPRTCQEPHWVDWPIGWCLVKQWDWSWEDSGGEINLESLPLCLLFMRWCASNQMLTKQTSSQDLCAAQLSASCKLRLSQIARVSKASCGDFGAEAAPLCWERTIARHLRCYKSACKRSSVSFKMLSRLAKDTKPFQQSQLPKTFRWGPGLQSLWFLPAKSVPVLFPPPAPPMALIWSAKGLDQSLPAEWNLHQKGRFGERSSQIMSVLRNSEWLCGRAVSSLRKLHVREGASTKVVSQKTAQCLCCQQETVSKQKTRTCPKELFPSSVMSIPKSGWQQSQETKSFHVDQVQGNWCQTSGFLWWWASRFHQSHLEFHGLHTVQQTLQQGEQVQLRKAQVSPPAKADRSKWEDVAQTRGTAQGQTRHLVWCWDEKIQQNRSLRFPSNRHPNQEAINQALQTESQSGLTHRIVHLALFKKWQLDTN